MEDQRGLRITTWNVNGIRNPFQYPPWNRDRTFAAMFETLEADIVIMQECKIQRKDLLDDMVLVPGWDVFFSLPKHKKGYSGVAIYTRNSVCAPIRAEEGITGILTPPNSTISYRELLDDQQIGGYPTYEQLANLPIDPTILDSEGRCVVLEFPAFVLIGVYCPANRDETRDDFRIGFIDALDIRVRNLLAGGKKVFLAGDLNIIRDEIDTANAKEQLKKHGMSVDQYVSTPARRMLNQLVLGGKVLGERDEGREKSIMWDLCRLYHPDREGMFTCWEQKTNARPGNFGSRIDYVLCSYSWNNWFCDANIQEGLLGSDHCPVYAVLKEKVDLDGKEVDIKDLMSADMFKDGVRQRSWSARDLLPLSARLIPEFNNRRSIRDMFTKKPSLPGGTSASEGPPAEIISPRKTTIPLASPTPAALQSPTRAIAPPPPLQDTTATTITINQEPMANRKRSIGGSGSATSPRVLKRGKSSISSKSTSTAGKGLPAKGQSSLMGFFKPKATVPQAGAQDGPLPAVSFESPTPELAAPTTPVKESTENMGLSPKAKATVTISPRKSKDYASPDKSQTHTSTDKTGASQSPSKPFILAEQKDIIDPIVSKESWSKLLGKRVLPKCEHGEDCQSMKVKKPGENCGRSFFMCDRPLGPSGKKEKDTQWRCGTFIWSSDWQRNDT